MLLHRIRSYPILSKKVLGVLIIIVFFAAILEIWLVNRLSNYGQQIAKVEQSTGELQVQNQILKNQIDTGSSLASIADQAKELGFQPVRNIQYLAPVDVAFNSK